MSATSPQEEDTSAVTEVIGQRPPGAALPVKLRVIVKGGAAVKISTTGLEEVDDLVQEAYEMSKTRLQREGVSRDELLLYRSATERSSGKTPFSPETPLAGICGGQDCQTLFYVHYETPVPPSGPATVQASAAELLGSKLDALSSKIGHLDSAIGALDIKVDSKIGALDDKVDSKIGHLDSAIGALDSKVDIKIGALDDKVDSKIGALDRKVDSKIGALDSKIESMGGLYHNLTRIQRVPSVSGSSCSDAFHTTVANFQGVDCCMVLSSLFKQDSRTCPKWLTHPNPMFPAVAEHIVPKAQSTVAQALGFHVQDERNGLLLLKAIEARYQSFEISFILEETLTGDGISLRIHVLQELHGVQVVYPERPPYRGRHVLVRHARGAPLQPLLFGDLHGKTFHVSRRPYVRALYAKAASAHEHFPELPNPVSHLTAYQGLCQKLELQVRLDLLFKPSLAAAEDSN